MGNWTEIGEYSIYDDIKRTHVPATLYVNELSPFRLPYDHIGLILVPDDVGIGELDLDTYEYCGILKDPDIEYNLEEARNAKLLKMGFTEEEIRFGATETEDGEIDVDLDDVKAKWSKQDTEDLTQKIVEYVYDCTSETILTDLNSDLIEEIDTWFYGYVYDQIEANASYYFTIE